MRYVILLVALIGMVCLNSFAEDWDGFPVPVKAGEGVH